MRPRLGIIAGGGALPRYLAEDCAKRGDSYRVFGIRGAADSWAESHPGDSFDIWNVEGVLGALLAADCQEVCLAGRVARPALASRPEGVGQAAVKRLLPELVRGDDSLLRSVAALFEDRGLRVIGVQERLPELLVGEGPVVGERPQGQMLADAERGASIVDALGRLDVGQAAVVAEGRCIGVETTDGTDAMLRRVAGQDQVARGGAHPLSGVLVKAPKPGQDRRFDLPTVGPGTVASAAAAGLRGIALEADGVLVVEREEFVSGAEAAGVCVWAYAPR